MAPVKVDEMFANSELFKYSSTSRQNWAAAGWMVSVKNCGGPFAFAGVQS